MITTTFISAQNSVIIDATIGTQSTGDFNKNEKNINITSSHALTTTTAINNAVEYTNTSFNIKTVWNNAIEQLNNLQKVSYTLGVKQSLSSQWSIQANINPVAAFKSNFKTSEIILLGGLGLEHSFSPKTQLTVGLQRNTYFGKKQILPTVTLHHQISNSINVDLGFPSTQFSYSNNPHTTFRLSTQIQGSYYTITPQLQDSNSNSTLQLSTISSLVEFERNIDSDWFLTFKGGYQNNSTFKLTESNTVTNHNNTEGLIAAFGIKYKL